MDMDMDRSAAEAYRARGGVRDGRYYVIYEKVIRPHPIPVMLASHALLLPLHRSTLH